MQNSTANKQHNPIILDNQFITSIIHNSIEETYIDVILSKKFKDFAVKKFSKKTISSLNKNPAEILTVSASILANSKKYKLTEYKNYRYSNHSIIALKLCSLHYNEYISDFIINTFKTKIYKILYTLLQTLYDNNGVYYFSKTERLLKINKYKLYIKFFEKAKILYKYYPENNAYELIICLDNNDNIKEYIDLSKIKIQFNSIKQSKDFDINFKNSFILPANLNINNNTEYNKPGYTIIYITIKITDNVYISLIKFDLSKNKELYYCTINSEKFSTAINSFIDENKLYNLINNYNNPEAKLLSNIITATPDNLLYSTFTYNQITCECIQNKRKYTNNNYKIIYIHCLTNDR